MLKEEVDEEDVALVVAKWTGIPVSRMLEGEMQKLVTMEERLGMRVIGQERIYAVGDCVSFAGPKLGHMAVRQAEVAATNLAEEIDGHEPVSHYDHEMRLVIDESGSDSIYLHKDIWTDEPATVRQGRFWSWAKRVQQRYWEMSHS